LEAAKLFYFPGGSVRVICIPERSPPVARWIIVASTWISNLRRYHVTFSAGT